MVNAGDARFYAIKFHVTDDIKSLFNKLINDASGQGNVYCHFKIPENWSYEKRACVKKWLESYDFVVKYETENYKTFYTISWLFPLDDNTSYNNSNGTNRALSSQTAEKGANNG